MPVGLEYYDEATNTLVAGVDTNVFKLLGVVDVAYNTSGSGSISNASMSEGTTPDAWFMPTNGWAAGPTITATSSGISWTNDYPASFPWVGKIYYGFW